ncbi:MAG: iron-sulfur cluster assembly protein [Bacteroidota bacterium]
MNKAEKEIEEKSIEVLKTIFDPEIPVNIYDLGLIYFVKVKGKMVNVEMTLTSPNCPVAETLPLEVENKIRFLEEVDDCKVEIVFDPPWDQEMMTEEAKYELGLL